MLDPSSAFTLISALPEPAHHSGPGQPDGHEVKPCESDHHPLMVGGEGGIGGRRRGREGWIHLSFMLS